MLPAPFVTTIDGDVITVKLHKWTYTSKRSSHGLDDAWAWLYFERRIFRHWHFFNWHRRICVDTTYTKLACLIYAAKHNYLWPGARYPIAWELLGDLRALHQRYLEIKEAHKLWSTSS